MSLTVRTYFNNVFKVIVFLEIFVPLIGLAQQPQVSDWQKQYDVWYKLSPRQKIEAPCWSANGRTLVYGWLGKTSMEWNLVDCESGKIRPAFDAEQLRQAFLKLNASKVDALNWPFKRIIPFDNGRLRLESEKESWWLEKDGKLVIASDKTSQRIEAKLNGNSHTINLGKIAMKSPTSDESIELLNGDIYLSNKQGKPTRHLFKRPTGSAYSFVGPISWSPNGLFFALWAEVKQPVRLYKVTNSIKNTAHDIPYEKPGDQRTERIPWVFSVDGQLASVCPPSILPKSYSTDKLDWSIDGKTLRTQFIRRGFTGHGVIAFNITSKVWRSLISEDDPKFVYSFKSQYRYDINENFSIWASERTGWNHLYAIDLNTGMTLYPITSGDWVMKQVLHIEREKEFIYFVGLGRSKAENPYHHHIYKVRFNGQELIDLTPGDANHEVQFSPNFTTLIDTSSRPDLSPSYTLRNALNGRLIASLGTTNTHELEKSGWSPTRRFVAKDRDGKFDIWGIITRPYPFDPKKKYPVIENIYAGPHSSFTPRTFNWWNRTHRELSLCGFYVVQMDGRGTNNRGKEFHQYSWRNLKDAGLLDRIAWMRALSKVEPSIDINRVGIFGGSAGGQNTAHALLLHGDFYKAGAADCGCYDNRIDKLWWNEQWLGYPIGTWYEANSCSRYAKNLKGQLLLTVGEADTNVDVKCSYDFRDALIAAGKSKLFEFHVVAGANHGAGESNLMRENRALFFQKYLGSAITLKE